MSDTTSIAMPSVYAPDASSAAVGLAWLAVVVVGSGVLVPAVVDVGLDRGRESVAMMTPDETTATAIFARATKEREREEKGEEMSSARVAGSRWQGEKKEKVRYYLLECISLA
jgi:hypothetical protein